MSDCELLERFVREQSQPAFTLLVERYLGLVYSAALRQVHSPDLAKDVAQTVFLELARRAGSVRDQPLAPWLYVVTRRTAVDLIRRESRRQKRERVAHDLCAANQPDSAPWSGIETLLDRAFEELAEHERAAIVLRFFQNLSLNDVGTQLGISSDTAQKRVSRGLDRLQRFFARHGIATTAAALASSLSAHGVGTAPAGLASSIGACASAAATAGGAGLLHAAWSKAAIGVAALVVAVGALELWALPRQAKELAAAERELAQLQAEADRLAAREEQARTAFARVRLRLGELSLTEQAESELDREVDAWLERVATLRRLFESRPAERIPELALLNEDDWFELSRDARFDDEAATRTAMKDARTKARRRAGSIVRRALTRYADAHEGMLPADPRELAPYTADALPEGTLERYEMRQSGPLSLYRSGEWLLAEKTGVDPRHDTRLVVTRGSGSTRAITDLPETEWRTALQRYAANHAGALPTQPGDLVPHFPVALTPFAVDALMAKSPQEFATEVRKIMEEQ